MLNGARVGRPRAPVAPSQIRDRCRTRKKLEKTWIVQIFPVNVLPEIFFSEFFPGDLFGNFQPRLAFKKNSRASGIIRPLRLCSYTATADSSRSLIATLHSWTPEETPSGRPCIAPSKSCFGSGSPGVLFRTSNPGPYRARIDHFSLNLKERCDSFAKMHDCFDKIPGSAY